jgi:hypothetical protein
VEAGGDLISCSVPAHVRGIEEHFDLPVKEASAPSKVRSFAVWATLVTDLEMMQNKWL